MELNNLRKLFTKAIRENRDEEIFNLEKIIHSNRALNILRNLIFKLYAENDISYTRFRELQDQVISLMCANDKEFVKVNRGRMNEIKNGEGLVGDSFLREILKYKSQIEENNVVEISQLFNEFSEFEYPDIKLEYECSALKVSIEELACEKEIDLSEAKELLDQYEKKYQFYLSPEYANWTFDKKEIDAFSKSISKKHFQKTQDNRKKKIGSIKPQKSVSSERNTKTENIKKTKFEKEIDSPLVDFFGILLGWYFLNRKKIFFALFILAIYFIWSLVN